MRDCPLTSRHPPATAAFRIVLSIEQFSKGIPEVRARSCKHMGKVGETCDTPLASCRIADMQNHACRDGSCGILPIALLRAIFASSDDHVRDILCIGNISRGK